MTIRIARRSALALAALPLAAPVVARAQAPAGELRVAVWDLPPSRGNPFGGRSVPSIFVWDALFDPLVRIGETGEAEPALALSWQAEEPRRWRFRLRPGAVFSNGTACNAEAVAATFAFLTSDAGRRSAVGSELREIASVRVVEAGPLRAMLEVKRQILGSPYTQRLSLSYNSPRLDITTDIDWIHEVMKKY